MTLKITSLLLVFLCLLWIFAYFWAPYQWQFQHQRLLDQLSLSNTDFDHDQFDPKQLEALPAPVKRYFNKVLKPRQPIVTSVKLSHDGQFNMGEAVDNWKPFQSEQWISVQNPGFLWDARIRFLPGINFFVRDGYITGKGLLTAKLWGGITVMSAPSTPELNQGELMRYLAEAAWYPTALLPSEGVHWQAIDAHQAQATLKQGETEVTLVYSFNENDLIETVSAANRYREINGQQVATPWQGRFWDYQWRNGMLIPLSGEVAWQLPEGNKPYWRARIQEITHQFTP
ncbi:hypothetical protein CYQ88_05550 [Hydrogenovibrio sp. SC-1]|uniref:DUF6920 family protein n=1 Tax=Hydrogenovibrio sp. SC-1 TaxID=2065820 RepID=UPI000C7C4529|nr:DUF6544 family protein [Hydrogenovibrio sp. SC-1]PLA74545.1 hypothetical protein CYQ88_05550 [Hydrogenovibrio sp. SC-1]